MNPKKNASPAPPALPEVILEKMRAGQLTLEDAEELVNFSGAYEYGAFFNRVAKLFEEQSDKTPKIKIYVPGASFQAISVTGTACELSCAHCDKKYLKNMIQAPSASSFTESLEKLAHNKAVGALISGGSTLDGKVPLLKYAREIKQFKATHEFYLNSHVGLVSYEEALQLKDIGIDVVSYDLVLDPVVIKDVFHMPHSPEDYINTYQNLKKAGLRVVPHILIGARFGYFAEEFEALKILMGDPPELLVFIVMIPPKNTAADTETEKVHTFNLISAALAAKFILASKYLLPQTEFSLGCMRPRGKISIDLEKWAIQGGISRIEIPTRKTIKWLEESGYDIEYYGACCSVSEELESRARIPNITGRVQ